MMGQNMDFKCPKFIMILAGLLVIFSGLCPAARAADGPSDAEFGKRLQIKPYIGAGIFIPKEGDIGIAVGQTFGLIKSFGKESIFADVTYSESDPEVTILWASGNVRHTVVRIGYKQDIGTSERWLLGANLQTHRMDFGSKQMTSFSFAALVEYNFSKKWAVQFESAQVIKESDVRLGNFNIICLRYF